MTRLRLSFQGTSSDKPNLSCEVRRTLHKCSQLSGMHLSAKLLRHRPLNFFFQRKFAYFSREDHSGVFKREEKKRSKQASVPGSLKEQNLFKSYWRNKARASTFIYIERPRMARDLPANIKDKVLMARAALETGHFKSYCLPTLNTTESARLKFKNVMTSSKRTHTFRIWFLKMKSNGV